ncbi:regulator [Helicobacter sp. 13S00401-1]|uniref:response regulator n=1 Tax=Helicobacter sp. 13S00401-1 TaxID=1905758 RepID=UPI000BA73FE7|nr:response regulator [Helicobacter sp. 13S00401-1]PAF50985.1 regulator [Helicobacter sp. 13S00401-1]
MKSKDLSPGDYDSLKDLTILYAEDDNDTRNLSIEILEDYAGNLLVARDGLEAFNIFNSQKVDIVITDIIMPYKSGIELLEDIRASDKPATPVLITTAFLNSEYLLKAIKLRCDGYILKPLDMVEVLYTMKKVLTPKLQAMEIEYKNLLINVIAAFIGGRKIDIIKFLLDNCDKDKIFYGSYEDIMEKLNVSKPTIVKTFKQLIDTGLLIRVKNKVYKLHNNIESLSNSLHDHDNISEQDSSKEDFEDSEKED